MIGQHTPEQATIARAIERRDELRATGVMDADIQIAVAALEAITCATPATLDQMLDAALDVVLDGERLGNHGHTPVRELLHLRARLNGGRAGWPGRRSVLHIPVAELDLDGIVTGERVVAIGC